MDGWRGGGGLMAPVVSQAHEAHPANREILQALVAFAGKAGKTTAAEEYGRELAALDRAAGTH